MGPTTARPRLLLLGIVLLAFACSSRTRSACVGYSPEVTPASIDEISLSMGHDKATPQMNWPDFPEYEYRDLWFTLSLHSPHDEPCRSVPKDTTLAFNEAPIPVVELGGGENHFISRSAETTHCGSLRGQVANTALLGGPMKQVDVFRATASGTPLTITFAAGRPTVSVNAAKKELVVEFVGLDGTLRDARATPYFALWAPNAKEGIEVEQKAREGNRIRLGYDPAKLTSSKTWTLLGDVLMDPKATCAPARKSCKVHVGYPLRLTVAL